MHLNLCKRLINLGILLFVLSAAVVQPRAALAQVSEDPWSDPHNISQAGSSIDPSPVVDSTGAVHVIWQDEFSGYMYSTNKEGEWSKPVPLEFPFADRDFAATSPIRLVNDNTGFIHAYWLGPRNALYHSVVSEVSIDNPGAWSGTQELARFVSGYDTTVDEAGNLHLAYIRSRDDDRFPAGVYYSQSRDGYSWSAHQPLYQSPYYRTQALVNHHVAISATNIDDASRVHVAWDDPALNRVTIRTTNDGGATWGEPVDVARAGGTSFGGKPFGGVISSQGDEALVLWQSGVPQESCSLSYISSVDGGASWSQPQPLPGNLPGCPTENQFFTAPDGAIILMTTIEDKVYLLAWNGDQWSEPVSQEVLASFKDPVTNSLIVLSCRRATSDGQGGLYYTGCDPDETGDVWITSRLIGSVADWFPPAPAWSKPVTLASNRLQIFNPVSISDSKSRIHVFWTQEDELENGDLVVPIYHSRTSEEGWMEPSQIINSPDNASGHIQVAIDDKDRLFLVWDGQRSGEIYFSWASADQASSISEWTRPAILPSLKSINSSPDILVTSSGDLVVAYALVLNENRGIYLVSSSDTGESWSVPNLTVDGVAAELNMVDNPLLAQTDSGRLQMIFTQNAVPGDGEPFTMYYISSADDGVTWSQPVQFVDRPLDWFHLITPGGVQVQRFWQTVEENVSSIWQELSEDDGATWSRPINVTSFGGLPGVVDVVSDPAQRLHLLQVVADPLAGQILKQWTWDGERWSAQEDLSLSQDTALDVVSIDAVNTIDGRLGISYVIERSPAGEGQPAFELHYSERMLDIPLISQTPPAAQTPTPQPTPLATAEVIATEDPLATPVATQPGEQSGSSGRPLDITLVGLGIGWILVMGLVVGAVMYEMRRRRKK